MVTVAMTTERYLMIKYALKASYLFTIRRARMAVGTVTVVALFVNIHNCFTRGSSWNDALKTNVCSPLGEAGELFLHLIWPWVDASVYCYIPFFALLVLNILIITNINQSSELFLRLSMSHSRRLIENRQITLMLLFVTLAFLLLVGPVGVILAVEQNLLATGSALVKARHSFVRVIFNCLTYTNHAVNFLLYCISGRRFRKEVLRLFCRVHPTQKTTYNIK
ncbi:FMRFamide receptor-like [Pomacea canaliculata]|uniref:FMRFamide receptor-like n=1 Tax=Pomacea canaliculata TaxID=400727 RepID=UPI000D73DA73|nr:FMRFamide receptor-like [Pomacea canaliculata]